MSNLLVINSTVLPPKEKDPNYYAFGTPGNSLNVEKVVVRRKIPLPIMKARWMLVSGLVVDGDVQFIYGKAMLRKQGE